VKDPGSPSVLQKSSVSTSNVTESSHTISSASIHPVSDIGSPNKSKNTYRIWNVSLPHLICKNPSPQVEQLTDHLSLVSSQTKVASFGSAQPHSPEVAISKFIPSYSSQEQDSVPVLELDIEELELEELLDELGLELLLSLEEDPDVGEEVSVAVSVDEDELELEDEEEELLELELLLLLLLDDELLELEDEDDDKELLELLLSLELEEDDEEELEVDELVLQL
jgi:hypothetical protein